MKLAKKFHFERTSKTKKSSYTVKIFLLPHGNFCKGVGSGAANIIIQDRNTVKIFTFVKEDVPSTVPVYFIFDKFTIRN